MTTTNRNDTDWGARSLELAIDGRAVIDGSRRETGGASVSSAISPGSLRPIAELHEGTDQDVDLAVSAARQAFADRRWSGMSAAERGRILIRLADLLMENLDELALLETLDSGEPIAQTRVVDIPGSAETFRWYGELADKRFDEIPETPAGSTALVRRVPLGVVGAIVPWNYPLEIASWKLAPALAGGNSVVLKPAWETSLSALRLADLALEAGIPAGVLNVVPGRGATTGSRIARHPDVDVLAFTGSTAVAHQLLIDSGQSNMKRLVLEAGGKSANLIFADADLPAAAAKAAFGAFYNQGQICSANSRILIQREAQQEFLDLLVAAARDYEPRDPLAAEAGNGSLISQAHTDSVQGAIQRAAADGTLLSGGERLTITGSDAYLRPAIVTGLAADHELHRKEIFGPVVAVLPFDTEAEAIRLANDTDYGLAASLWTTDLSRAHRVSDRLVAGTVSVNTVDALGLTTPFGGFRQSGFGRDLSRHALDNYTDWKTTWIQHGA
ncbi:aldehyde dehydrogenase family protein [Acaricomes phytoseiuli]|uniref:aldehyde dehydrogenase family protein n=1 Tax=Acaricomes phytoseiuli TaxID=291968 RepID=UPI002222A2DB|nr:aldehyde dehydrogenase family protein [Acaricomes phytoseiuli]MCW1249279.1 aldehyde dehydrogenase family protein [Acaricomes phytoseiuli]